MQHSLSTVLWPVPYKETLSPQYKGVVPLHLHDCESCLFLGHYQEIKDLEIQCYDLYFCPSKISTFLARYGSDPAEYKSGPFKKSPGLKQAIALAIAHNLIELDLEKIEHTG